MKLGWGRPISRRDCGVVYRLLVVFLIGRERVDDDEEN